MLESMVKLENLYLMLTTLKGINKFKGNTIEEKINWGIEGIKKLIEKENLKLEGIL